MTGLCTQKLASLLGQTDNRLRRHLFAFLSQRQLCRPQNPGSVQESLKSTPHDAVHRYHTSASTGTTSDSNLWKYKLVSLTMLLTVVKLLLLPSALGLVVRFPPVQVVLLIPNVLFPFE